MVKNKMSRFFMVHCVCIIMLSNTLAGEQFVKIHAEVTYTLLVV